MVSFWNLHRMNNNHVHTKIYPFLFQLVVDHNTFLVLSFLPPIKKPQCLRTNDRGTTSVHVYFKHALYNLFLFILGDSYYSAVSFHQFETL